MALAPAPAQNPNSGRSPLRHSGSVIISDMHTGLQKFLLDVPYLTLLMQRLGQQNYQTALLIATVSPRFYLILNIRLNIYLDIRQNRSTWLPTSNTLRCLG